MRTATLTLIFVLAGSAPAVAADFVRGDCDSSGSHGLNDAIRVLDHLFVGSQTVHCVDACDGNDDGSIGIIDAVAILSLVFDPAITVLPAPFPNAGDDPTEDGLSCDGLDADGDGFIAFSEDCDDSDPNVNPAAYDIPGNGIDEDCNGIVDDGLTDCSVPSLTSDPASDLAGAIGLCSWAAGDDDWGLVSASIEHADGSPYGPSEQSRVRSEFGVAHVPTDGNALLALSTGTAATPTDPNYSSPLPGSNFGHVGLPPADLLAANGGSLPTVTSCTNPPGPCLSSPQANDSVCLKVVVRVPSNANGLEFDYAFLSSDHAPFLACTSFNDWAAVLVDSGAQDMPADGNVLVDGSGAPITVNADVIEACDPNAIACNTCPLGTGPLAGTGFDTAGGAGTGWRTVNAPVVPGETITVRFMVWDSGDHAFDSTLLVDGFRWVE